MDINNNSTINVVASQWLNRAKIARDSHYKQGKILKRRHTAMGVTICILSAIVGSSIFASISQAAATPTKILVGMLSIAASGLAGLNTFLNTAEKSEKHRLTAIRFSSLVRKLEIIISSASGGEDTAHRSLEEVQKEWDSINYDSPLAPMDVWLPTVAEISRQQMTRE